MKETQNNVFVHRNKSLFSGILLIVIAAIFIINEARSEVVVNTEDDLEWTRNYSYALQEAKRTGKPIFLEFRCGP